MSFKDFVQRVFTPGTVECAVACGILGILVAVMLLTIGIWKTLLIVALVALGAFLGGVKDKKAFIRKIFGGNNGQQ